MSGTSDVNRYVPTLDGLRAVSILLVIVGHFGFRAIVPGIFGVTIFFFVSGYLITGQLLAEIGRSGTISLGGFYVRRALRLFPALFVMIAASAAMFPALGAHLTTRDVIASLFYLANYWPWFFGDFDMGIPHVSHPFAVLWSLAVEEHYYLVFPLLCLCVGRNRFRFAALIVGLIAVITVWRLHVAASCPAWGCPDLWVEHATDTRADSILYGALLATLLASPLRDATLQVVARIAPFVAGLVLLLASLLIRDQWFRDTWRFTLQGIGLFLCVGALLFGRDLAFGRRLLSLPAVLRIGRWSYSLYLWHWFVFCLGSLVLPSVLWEPLLRPGFPPTWWLARVFVPMTVLSFALAAASYYFIERPMVRLRRRYGSHAVADGGTVPAVAPGSGDGLRRGQAAG